jgi:SAM-dependent methyltransferase
MLGVGSRQCGRRIETSVFRAYRSVCRIAQLNNIVCQISEARLSCTLGNWSELMASTTLDDDDYIIGANQVEIDRLGLQHAIWRESAMAAWRRAGIKPGMTVLDIGAGPGYASFDLARLVGPAGKVIAMDQSALFLDALREGARHRGLVNIEVVESDLADFQWPDRQCDAVWSRWCLSFVPDPELILSGVDRALKSNGIFVSQEYVDYRTMKITPSDPIFDAFVDAVEASWRHFQGDPNVGCRFPAAFASLGWALEYERPIIHATRPGDVIWNWPTSWFQHAPARLVELGFFTREQADCFDRFIAQRNADPNSMLMTPMVMESVARKPA